MLEVKRITYDITDEASPQPGEYLVGMSFARKRVLSVSLIKTVREVKAIKPRTYRRFALEILAQPGLAELTEFEFSNWTENDMTVTSALVWVKGEKAHPFFWHPRGGKK